MKKILYFVLVTLFISLPMIAKAQDAFSYDNLYEARVVNVLDEKDIFQDGKKITQQNLRLVGLKGELKDIEFDFYGISDIRVLLSYRYKVGDKVMVNYIETGGQREYFIIDYVRRGSLYLLAFIFTLLVILVGRKKGLMSLISLGISFFIIMKLIIPFIILGYDPVLVSTVGGLMILTILVYLTEGFNKKSHLGILSLFITLSLVLIFSIVFTKLARLTGLAQEDAIFLIGSFKEQINFQGLLLAGIIIGTVGALDDVVINQIEIVENIRLANKDLTNKQVWAMSLSVGRAHFGAMINTLFLAYAGASLPLLLLFGLNDQGLGFLQAVNKEVIATEVIRSLIGAIGVAISLPISTYLAVKFKK